MIITPRDVMSYEMTTAGMIDWGRDPNEPYPNGGLNTFSIFVEVDGVKRMAVCVNTRVENYQILHRLYPDVQMEVIAREDGTFYMKINDPRVGPEWLIKEQDESN